MLNLRTVSGDEVIRALERLGWRSCDDNTPKRLTYYAAFLNELADFEHWISWDAMIRIDDILDARTRSRR